MVCVISSVPIRILIHLFALLEFGSLFSPALNKLLKVCKKYDRTYNYLNFEVNEIPVLRGNGPLSVISFPILNIRYEIAILKLIIKLQEHSYLCS